VCRDYASRQGWLVVDSYSDRAISGTSMLRPGLQELIADASGGRFDMVLAEAMDRLSRDQEGIAGLFKRLSFAAVRMVTIAEGDINEMHIGLKGTMNALYLKDLGQKTRRGLQGRAEAGKCAGGKTFGYDTIRNFGSDGSYLPGDRAINPTQADVVRRIFGDYANGQSPLSIAHALNREKIPGPSKQGWGPSTIYGNASRGTGILNNQLYRGIQVWNRLRYLKNPANGKRISRLNPDEDLVITELPELRIIPQELWQRVKDRQAIVREKSAPPQPEASSDATNRVAKPKTRFWAGQRPHYLLTGLMRCGACGGGYTKISSNLFGCATARNKGTCDNRLNIRVDAIEAIVLDGLKHHLMAPSLFKEFAAAFIAERNTIIAQQNSHFSSAKEELAKVKSRLKILVNAVADGGPARSLGVQIAELETREDELNALLANQPASEPSLHPNLAQIYRDRVAALQTALLDPESQDEAFDIIRTLIEEVRLVPEDGKLRVELRGALAGILALAYNDKTHLRHGADGSVSVLVEQVKLVAGARFERAAFRL
jgi:DNA invertase Pin-like site-specific DNA recombinase